MGRRGHIVARAALVALALVAASAASFVVAATSAASAMAAGASGASTVAPATTSAPTASAPPPATPSSCRNADLLPTPTNLSAVTTATICLIDQLRAAHRLAALRVNHVLQTVAAGQSQEMVQGNYFGDDTRSGETPLQRIVAAHYLGYGHEASVGQNIGWGTGPYATPAGMVQEWTQSPPHRQIMLSGEYRNVGVGVAPAAPAVFAEGQPGATYTVDFAVRK